MTGTEAKELLEKIRSSRPQDFFGKLDTVLTGVGYVLTYLDSADGVVLAGDLARELNVSTARIAALLNKMERNGLVMRTGTPDDARKTVVEITQAGRIFLHERQKELMRMADVLIEKVGKDDINEFIRISGEIRNALEE